MPPRTGFLFLRRFFSDLLAQAQPRGEALVIAMATVLPALPRMKPRRQSWMAVSATQPGE